MRKIMIVALVAFLLGVAACAPKSNPAAEKAAVDAAQEWLALVDQGRYAESWDEASAYFQNAMEKDKWQAALQAVRNPLGKMIERKVKSSRYATSLPGAPDGAYVVIQFQARFENKESAVETVTPMRDQDGRWRVAGYYIK